MTMTTLDARFGTSVAGTVSELTDIGYVTAPDAATVELTDHGFEASQRGD